MNSSLRAEFAQAFQESLNCLKPAWTFQGEALHGPGGALIRFSSREGTGPACVEIEFVLDETDPNSIRIRDHVRGFGSNATECANTAAHIWVSTSGGALLELKYSRRGEYADHFRGNDPQGLTGWHCICGAVLGYGEGNSGSLLQEWWLSHHKVLPAIAGTLAQLSPDRPHSIKMFFGARDIAEVCVDDEIHDEASAALLALDWPRSESPDYLRVFVIALHRE